MERPAVARSGRFSYFVYRLGSALITFVPRSVALAAGEAGGRLAARLSTRRRAVVTANLRHVLPDAPPAELERVVTESFASYGRYWADSAKLGPGDRRHLARRIHVEGIEHVLEAHRKGGFIFALPHLGAWEIGGLWADEQGFPFVTVAEDAASPELFEWFVRRRERLGMRILPIAADTSARLLRTLESGDSVALVADRLISGEGMDVEFFGATTKVPIGPAVLALRSGAALIPSAIYQDGPGYRLVFRPPIDTGRGSGRLREDVRRVTAELIASFEELIRERPEQWHVFQPNWPATSADAAG